MNEEPDLYEYLRKECSNLETAKVWIHRWATEWGQKLPWQKLPWQKLPWQKKAGYTLRAMCGHVSNVLEGGTENTGYAAGNLVYFETKYGTELYWALCEP